MKNYFFKISIIIYAFGYKTGIIGILASKVNPTSEQVNFRLNIESKACRMKQ